jgi:hypothetical protein
MGKGTTGACRTKQEIGLAEDIRVGEVGGAAT